MRPLTISDTIANIFEKYLLSRIETNHQYPQTQFGFKTKSSTNHGIYTVMETIQHFKHKKKKLFICAIDASKAFDKVIREIMLQSLIGKIEPENWRILKNYYVNSLALVQNKQEISTIFKTSVGVKQGGPLSPKLFSIYVEELIYEIMGTDLIAKINDIKTGILMYADDLLIMTDSTKKMKKVLEICEKFGDRVGIKFNPSKTQIMRINGSKNDEVKLHLCNQEIEWVKKMKYLGVWIDGKRFSKEHLRERRLSTWRAFHMLKTNLNLNSKEISPKLKAHLFKTYIRPIMYYGIENCVISKTDQKNPQTMEGLMIKQMLSLGKKSRTTNLLYALEIEPVELKIKKHNKKHKFTQLCDENQSTNNKFIQELRNILESNDEISIEKLKKSYEKIQENDANSSKNETCEAIKK
ncbi:RNA-directed DNA polymerase from mobile element jockey-like [Brachionus plicatilis]|uniref:RNA-directed DNA polymerase from mobile element jockey-like n=1 Tax=Brachionus plicatilis TaxID=10195 RepID=A0A3M7R8M2_BRAPC|nr:RNA-directed DNA polymerase from mobile element jockey-like [Brachionus plicatilis]